MINKLLENKEFKRKIKKASKMVESNGYESAFAFAKINDESVFSDVVSCECADVMPEKGFEEIFLPFFYKEDIVIKVEGTAHFHPQTNELLIPSEEDLKSFFWKIKDDIIVELDLKWMVLGMVDSGKIKLLCLSLGTASEADVLEWISYTSLESFFFTEELQKKVNEELTYLGFEVEYRTL